MDVDARRQELISELNEFQMQDRFIADTKKTIQELNEERDAHSDIIQQINQVCFISIHPSILLERLKSMVTLL